MSDPWKHRSSGMKCSTCMWYVEKEAQLGVKTVGRCRRHSPTMNGYPVVYPTDWCGDHKLDETKLAPPAEVPFRNCAELGPADRTHRRLACHRPNGHGGVHEAVSNTKLEVWE